MDGSRNADRQSGISNVGSIFIETTLHPNTYKKISLGYLQSWKYNLRNHGKNTVMKT